MVGFFFEVELRLDAALWLLLEDELLDAVVFFFLVGFFFEVELRLDAVL